MKYPTFKEITFKYKLIEVIEETDCLFPTTYGLYKYEEALRNFKDREVVSVKNYDDTFSTSVMLKKLQS